ncbi:hypothetical protein ASD55_08265 [Rhodanobacter sp. Root561]|nr:hypothetical protein ASD55_08265 [Rhodanobacter sp. Root561]
MVIVDSSTHIEFAFREVAKALAAIEPDGSVITRIDTKQKASRARGAGLLHGLRKQTLAGPASVVATKQIDAFQLEVTRWIGQRKVGWGENQITHGGVARNDLRHPDPVTRILEPLPVLGRRVGRATVFDDGGTIQHAGERFKKGRLPHQGQRIFISDFRSPDRYLGCH